MYDKHSDKDFDKHIDKTEYDKQVWQTNMTNNNDNYMINNNDKKKNVFSTHISHQPFWDPFSVTKLIHTNPSTNPVPGHRIRRTTWMYKLRCQTFSKRPSHSMTRGSNGLNREGHRGSGRYRMWVSEEIRKFLATKTWKIHRKVITKFSGNWIAKIAGFLWVKLMEIISNLFFPGGMLFEPLQIMG